MSIVGQIIERRASLEASNVPLSGAAILEAWSGPKTATGRRVSQEGALRIGTVLACVQVISRGVSALPLPVYRRLSPRGKTRATEHPLYRILHDRPNPWMTSASLREALQGHLCLWGNAFCEIMRDNNGRVTGLFPLRPDRMQRPSVSASGDLLYPYSLPSGALLHLPQSRVLHLRGLSSDGIWGYSPISLQREALGLALTAEEFAGRFFGNSAQPGGVLQVDKQLSPEAANRLRQSWTAAHSGLENAHRVAVLEEGIKWQSVGMPLRDAEFLDLRRYQRSEIAGWFLVPPHMIGDVDRATSWGCLPGNTPVFTTRGQVPIKDIRKGDEVWSLSEGGLVPSVVRAQWMTGIRQTMTLATAARVLRLTNNHRVLVRRYQAATATKPACTDCEERPSRTRGLCNRCFCRRWRTDRAGLQSLPLQQPSFATWQNAWIRADEVRSGDYLAVPHDLPEGQESRSPAGRELTVGAMEFCGMYLGDGSRDGNRVEIAHESDPDYMEHYRNIIQDEFEATPAGDLQRTTRTRFSSREAIQLLEEGFTGTAHTKRVPGWVFGLRRDLQLALLRGLVDSDGCIQRGRIVFSSANRALLEDVRHLCMQVGVPSGRVARGRAAGTGVIRGRTINQTEKYQLALSSIPYNGLIGSNSEKKRANLQTPKNDHVLSYDEGWRGMHSRKRRATATPGHGWTLHNLKLQRVLRTEAAAGPAIPVYDLTVEGTHSFLADGVLVHNSGIEAQTLGFVTYTLRPWLVGAEQQMNADLLNSAEQREYFVEHLLDGLLRGDTATRQAFYTALLDRGVFAINDVLELENRNPVEDGDRRFIQANMVPLDRVDDVVDRPSGGSPPAPSRAARAEDAEYRATDERAALRRQYRPELLRAAGHIVTAEVAAIRTEGLPLLTERSALDLLAWLEAWHRSTLAPLIVETLTPLLRAYAGSVERVILRELDLPGVSEQIGPFVDRYAARLAESYTGRSLGQLRTLLRTTAEQDGDLAAVIETRLAAWQDARAAKVADRETVQAGEAFARDTYRRGGVTKLKWRASSKACGFCARLNGKVVGIEGHFAGAGEELEGDAGVPKLRVKRPKRNPPIHSACSCRITKG